jgi:hypothetical protein
VPFSDHLIEQGLIVTKGLKVCQGATVNFE